MPRILGEYASYLLAKGGLTLHYIDVAGNYHLLSCVYRLEALFRAKPGDFSSGERAQVDVISLLC